MKRTSTVLAFDLGASSGRALIGELNQTESLLSVKEIHRFPNDPVQVGNHLHWDILRLLHELKQGLIKARNEGYQELQSMGIDSWAVDFGLLSESGELLGNPYHYRDAHTDGVMEEVIERLGKDYIFARSGLQFLPFNTIYQLAALIKRDASVLKQADKLLMIPDLLRYFLTGEKRGELTNASTTQLLNPTTGQWDEDLTSALGIPISLLPEPVAAGSRVGTLTAAVQAELGYGALPVIAVGEHDTASAVAAVPASEENFAYISCGTWSLLGTELSHPVLTEQALEWNFTNEGGVYGTNRLLKNIMGLWIIQECKRCWDKEGRVFGFGELVQLAQSAESFQSFIDPDDLRFLNPRHMPQQIQQYCTETNQPVPQTEGAIIRCVMESLALKYRLVLECTEQLAETRFNGLHMVGGGIQNTLLCQFTANAIGRPVWAGPIEASAIGNLVVQYMALGQIKDLQEARKIIRKSFPIDTYKPEQQDLWEAVYQRFMALIGK
ncbi:Rhamnulokinase [compost metagenome]